MYILYNNVYIPQKGWWSTLLDPNSLSAHIMQTVYACLVEPKLQRNIW